MSTEHEMGAGELMILRRLFAYHAHANADAPRFSLKLQFCGVEFVTVLLDITYIVRDEVGQRYD